VDEEVFKNEGLLASL